MDSPDHLYTVAALDDFSSQYCVMHVVPFTESRFVPFKRTSWRKFVKCAAEWRKYDCKEGDIVSLAEMRLSLDLVNIESCLGDIPSNTNIGYHYECYKRFCDISKLKRKEKSEAQRTIYDDGRRTRRTKASRYDRMYFGMNMTGGRREGDLSDDDIQFSSPEMMMTSDNPNYHAAFSEAYDETGMRKHKREKIYHCSLCDSSFSWSSDLKRHIRTHTGEKPYKCDVCGSAFAQASYLRVHNRSHTGERPHKCTQCDSAFPRASHLRAHLRTHTGEKPHTCCYCKVGFSSGASLRRHIRKHTGEKPFKCSLCDKAYADSRLLKLHIKAHARAEKLTKTKERNQAEEHTQTEEHTQAEEHSHTEEQTEAKELSQTEEHAEVEVFTKAEEHITANEHIKADEETQALEHIKAEYIQVKEYTQEEEAHE